MRWIPDDDRGPVLWFLRRSRPLAERISEVGSDSGDDITAGLHRDGARIGDIPIRGIVSIHLSDPEVGNRPVSVVKPGPGIRAQADQRSEQRVNGGVPSNHNVVRPHRCSLAVLYLSG